MAGPSSGRRLGAELGSSKSSCLFIPLAGIGAAVFVAADVAGAKERFGVWSVVADGLFGLRRADGSTSHFLLELDRGHMPNLRHRGALEQSSIGRKLGIYYEGWKADRHVEQFGVKQLRVLIVTTSMVRVGNMIDVVKEITGGGSNFFLFIDRERLAASSPFEAQWVSGKGEAVKLVD